MYEMIKMMLISVEIWGERSREEHFQIQQTLHQAPLSTKLPPSTEIIYLLN